MAGRTFGVDEAGKGPALGSMFAAAVVADPAALPDGVDDSKRLQPARREELAARIRADDDVAVGVAEITVERIDDPATDMNRLTVAAHAEALADALQATGSVDGGGSFDGLTGYVDAGERDADRFGARVADRVAADVDVRAEHEADATYPVVGAASIVAKVERDAHVARLAERFGDLGSGYPGDPATRTFIRDWVRTHDGLPDCARESWQTCRDALAAAEQSGLDEF
jgi:ribonuclease HII